MATAVYLEGIQACRFIPTHLGEAQIFEFDVTLITKTNKYSHNEIVVKTDA